MNAPSRLAGSPSLAAAPTLGYLAVVASLAPLGLNIAVGLQPVFADGTPLDAAGRGNLVALYALGLALGQLSAGDAADRWGRRPTMLAGLALAVLGALIAVSATGANALLAGRLLTGLGLGTVLVVPRAVLRDLHQGAALQRASAILALVFALAPALTPPLSWAIAAQSSWRMALALVVVLTALAAGWTWRAQAETRPAGTTASRPGAWLALWRQRRVRSTTLAFAAIAAPFFIFAAAGPAALAESTGAGGGTAALVLGASYLGFAFGNHWVKQRAAMPGERLVTTGLAIALAGLALVALTLAWPGLVLWTVALTVYAVGHGIVFPSAFALVLQDMPQRAGLAAAGIGTVHLGMGALGAWLPGVLSASAHGGALMATGLAAALSCAAWMTFPFDEKSS